MPNLKELTLKQAGEVLASWQEPPYRARQIFSWIYKKGVEDFNQMTDLSRSLRKKLKQNFSLFDLKLTQALKSSDGTEKFLFALKDKRLIEAVSIPAKSRVTGCISTQVGCKFGCKFCASGMRGFKRNLSVAEIIEQALYLKNYSQGKKLTHLVFMGIGEPLDNYDNTLKAIRIINSSAGLNIGARRITISTAGIIPALEKLSPEGLQIELSVSLHASDNKTRSMIMPINKIYSLDKLLKASSRYVKETNRQITFEYILIKGVNSDLQSAKNLSTILRGLNCKVNLIPANSIEELKIQPPKKIEILIFKDYLLKSGINVTLRKPRGEDIAAACGQLRLRYEKQSTVHSP